MARAEKASKTALGDRLRSIRRTLGDPDRLVFSEKLGISKNSLAAYERGENEPAASTLGSYASIFGISVQWLVSGEGGMFLGNSAKINNAGTALLDRDVMKIAIEAVEEGLGGCAFPADKKAELILNGYDLILKDRLNRHNVVLFARAARC